MEKVGERLTEERKRLGKTVAGMASECDVSKQAQINFEKDRQLPGGAYLIAAAVLGVDVSYVLTGLRNPAITPDEKILLDNYRNSSPEGKVAIKSESGEDAPARRQIKSRKSAA